MLDNDRRIRQKQTSYRAKSLVLFEEVPYKECLGSLDGMQDLNSQTRDQTLAPCSGSAESQSLDYWASPQI